MINWRGHNLLTHPSFLILRASVAMVEAAQIYTWSYIGYENTPYYQELLWVKSQNTEHALEGEITVISTMSAFT